MRTADGGRTRKEDKKIIKDIENIKKKLYEKLIMKNDKTLEELDVLQLKFRTPHFLIFVVLLRGVEWSHLIKKCSQNLANFLLVFHQMPYFLQHFSKNWVKTLVHGTLHKKLLISRRSTSFGGFSPNALLFATFF